MMSAAPKRRDYVVDQGQTWSGSDVWAPGGIPMNFAGYSAALDLRVDPDSATPTIRVTTVPSSLGLFSLDVFGNYGWEVEASALAALTPIQRALSYCMRSFYVDGVRQYDLQFGFLYLRRNGVMP